ncbi:hypothetical protein N5C96_29335 [Delftia tsuruhatensis]|uniref:hypothetical protein n=1 Tax=Delftia tsuruhatensis TaxID=180282 RepID=UPI002444D21A|nr:hypothetical protein [Delftia tsuruhatensis]MDH0777523.1 hypothetical protein [Delftia tsuruhatensis]MDH1461859.1 hypothetical protein [Delftia tsuruhatensis]WGG09962.1 hypothetical protein N5O86_25460 [Delftia tsuruhatensis]
MTPRDQIQEHAKTAAAKIRDAMTEFSNATGMRATVDVGWIQLNCMESATPEHIVTTVRLHIDDEALG